MMYEVSGSSTSFEDQNTNAAGLNSSCINIMSRTDVLLLTLNTFSWSDTLYEVSLEASEVTLYKREVIKAIKLWNKLAMNKKHLHTVYLQ